jgi:hypothetical protein
MLRKLTVSLTFLIAAISANCEASANYPAPPLAGPITVSDSPYALDKVVSLIARVGDSQVYLLQTGGGSLALGLFAPGGALLNRHLIAEKSERMAATVTPTGRFDIEAQIKDRVDKATPNPTSDSLHPFVLAGALLISVDADNQVRSTLVINVKDTSAASAWAKSYFYHFTTKMDSKTFQNGGSEQLLQDIAKELDHAIDSTTGVVLDDLSGKLSSGVPVKITSECLRPLGKVIIPFKSLRVADRDDLVVMRVDGKPGMIRFPTVDGIHLFHADQFALKQ